MNHLKSKLSPRLKLLIQHIQKEYVDSAYSKGVGYAITLILRKDMKRLNARGRWK